MLEWLPFGLRGVLIALAAAAVAWLAFSAGESAGLRQLAEYRGQVAEQRQKDTAAAADRLRQQSAQLAASDARLADQDTALQTLKNQLNRSLTRAAHIPVPAAADAGLLSVDGLRFYNAAFGLRAADASAAAGTADAENAAAGAADSGYHARASSPTAEISAAGAKPQPRSATSCRRRWEGARWTTLNPAGSSIAASAWAMCCR